ncbi:ATP-binding protein [Salicibibacter cibi]|uniref:ATP-binding protein n=1 Tax=Salicibibacter cibi TaxID=2743001 RepID=A0A7T6Z9S4_9BACI|nr:ATP-binding protein [Salicibibacter cibi]QQK79509.1 ATP-binding protein [Salicibibacter cibi]
MADVQTPMKTMYRNLLLTRGGDVWAYHRIKAKSIPKQNEKEVESYKKRWREFLQELTKYQDFHFMMYPQEYQLHERFENLKQDVALDTEDMANYYLDETESLLGQRLGTVTKSDFIVGVRLRADMVRIDADVKENMMSMLSTATDTIVNLLGWEQEVTTSFFEKYQEAEQELADTMGMVDGAPLTEKEMIYINRYHFIRGLDHQVSEEMANASRKAVTNTLIDPTSPSVLNLNSDEDEGYISFVVIDEFPRNMADSDLFYETQALPFPVEVDIKAQVESKSQTKMKVNMKKKQLRESAREQNQTGDETDASISESDQMIRNLQDDIKKDDVHMFNWMAVVIVDGQTKKDCLTRAKMVKRRLKSMGIVARIPVADQLSLFYKFLPGEPIDVKDRNWMQKTSQDGLAECLFGVNASVGSNIGFFVGWIDRFEQHKDLDAAIGSSRDPVFFHPFLANQQIKGTKTKSPHVLITGDTGNGKSFLAKLLFIYISLLDIKCLYIDPKKELRKWIRKVMKNQQVRKDFPLFVEHLERFHFITLDPEDQANWGALDPIVFLPSTQQKEMVTMIFEQVYDFSGKDDVHTAFLQSITKVQEQKEKGEKVGSMHVIYEMQAHEDVDVRKAGNFLYEVMADGVMRLCVHDGSNDALSLNRRISIVEIENLDLPEVNDSYESYTSEQLKSSAVMYALGRYCELFGQNKDERTAEFMDEAWMLTSNPTGKKVEKKMRRVGRSYSNALYFISQSTKDALREEESNNFGVAFAFDEPTEREDVLKWMNMEASDENIDMLDGMFQGQCLFKDYYRRTAKISVECLFDEWAGVFETVEASAVATAEEMWWA